MCVRSCGVVWCGEEGGALRGNETEKERRGGGGGTCDRHAGERMRRGDGVRGGLSRPIKVGVKKSKAS